MTVVFELLTWLQSAFGFSINAPNNAVLIPIDSVVVQTGEFIRLVGKAFNSAKHSEDGLLVCLLWREDIGLPVRRVATHELDVDLVTVVRCSHFKVTQSSKQRK